MESIRENCQRSYSLHREVSVNEAMVGFKGRSSMKQYCPMKPTKRGYKVWVLSDAHTEYMYNFTVYCGATPGVTEHGLGASVVCTMTEPVLEKGHCLFFDNYFSTVPPGSVLADEEQHLLCCHSTHGSNSLAHKSEKHENPQATSEERRPPFTNCFFWCPVLHVDGQESCTVHQYRLQSIPV